MPERWTQAEKDWLAEHYAEGTINDTVAGLERDLGVKRSTQAVFIKAQKMGLRKLNYLGDRARRAEKMMRWSSKEFERERAWMLENDTTESVQPTIDAFEAEFGVRLTRAQVSLFRCYYGNRRRISHGGGMPCKPVGATRLGKDGYLMVKVTEWPERPSTKDNWRFMHHLVWEEANGRPVPDGCVIMFADGDKSNFDPENLVAVPRKIVGVMNSPGAPRWSDRQTLMACIKTAELKTAIFDAEARIPRKCGVCGREFVPEQKRYRHNPKTCPECRAAGIKSRGDRGDKQPTVCEVCGEVFARESKSMRRCPSCIAAKPHMSVESHRRFYELHGTRA